MIGKEIKWRSDLRRDVNPLRVALFRRWNVPEESLRTRDLSWNTSEDSRFRDDDLGKFTGMILLVLSQLLVLDREVYAILNYFFFDVTFFSNSRVFSSDTGWSVYVLLYFKCV